MGVSNWSSEQGSLQLSSQILSTVRDSLLAHIRRSSQEQILCLQLASGSRGQDKERVKGVVLGETEKTMYDFTVWKGKESRSI
ncbi:hypothetical protein Y1Q_0021461 [Alligator mississippiensis]|uniref:Uncharacterized protein n=1 Tax=Alligator mississippiensis TaxID=8496 RepID=A0A151PA23_ALLMI|nr:hypothetical protein Y1Q_0021461 [Alligator mississippiensis]